MDAPYLILKKNHRQYFHDSFSAVAIARRLCPNDEKAVWAALYHIELDNMCSANPIFKQQLEFFAEGQSKKRKGKKKRSKGQPLPPEFRRFLQDLRKMAEIERLAKLILS